MEKNYISYYCIGVANNIYTLEILTKDGLMLFKGSLTECQAKINFTNN